MKTISFYLPQFHDEILNEQFWEKGFSDWTTSQKMKPLYKGHIQPKIPRDGCYDLLNINVMKHQCELAKSIGIDGFSFYYYQFDEELSALRKPLLNYINSDIDFPFCITWANHSWSKAWIGDSKTVIAEQLFDACTVDKFLSDLDCYTEKPNYIKWNDKYFVSILYPTNLDIVNLKRKFREAYGKELYVISLVHQNGVDLVISWPPGDLNFHKLQRFGGLRYMLKKFSKIVGLRKIAFRYTNLVSEKSLLERQSYETNNNPTVAQTILTGWDNTPRYKLDGYVVTPTTPENYVAMVRKILSKNRSNGHPVSFIKAWNEWAEGNVIEEKGNDINYGEAISDALDN
ncbi:MAG: glycoside hydrolase family 99-like domain-containing protein [Paracoccaceae bacterium]|jgi:hypothetical protein